MSDDGSEGGVRRGPSPFDELTNRVFGNPVVRGIAWCLFVAGLVFALLRASLMAMPSLEGIAGEWLEERFDAEISGLYGSWHRMAPRLSLDRLDFAYGHLQEVHLELDLFASLLALSPRVSAIEIADARLRFPSDFDLLDHLLNPRTDLDLLSLVERARFIAIGARVGLLNDPAELSLRWIGHKHRAHRGELWLGQVAADSQNGLRFGYDLDADSLLQVPEGAVWVEGSVNIPQAMKSMLGISGDFSSLGVNAQLASGKLALSMEVRAQDLEIGNFRSDEVTAKVCGEGDIGRISGELLEATFSRHEHVLSFQGTRFTLNSDATWQFSLPDQEIESLTGFLVQGALTDTALVRWSQRFAPKGLLRSMRGRVGREAPLVLAATIEEFSARSWLGSPSMDAINAKVIFTPGGARILIDTPQATLGLSKLFDAPVDFGQTRGEVRARFLPRYVGLHGLGIRANFPTGGSMRSNFYYSAPADPFERQLTAGLEAFGIDALDSLQFIPKTIPEAMRNWLTTAVKEGAVDHGQLVLGGYVRPQPAVRTMQIELWLEFRNAALKHHRLWPIATHASGRAELVGGVLQCSVDEAEMLGERFQDVEIEMPLLDSTVRFADAGEVDASFLAKLANTTPLAELLPDRVHSFNGRGPVRYDMEMGVPLIFDLSEITFESSVQLDTVDFGFQVGETLDLGGLLGGLTGSFEYRYPDRINSEGLSASLLSRPAIFSAHSERSGSEDSNRILARIDSHLDAAVMAMILGDAVAMQGTFAYAAELEIDQQSAVPIQFRFESDLQGISLEIPGGMGKSLQESVPLRLEVGLGKGFGSGAAKVSLAERVNGQVSWADLYQAGLDIRGKVRFGEGPTSFENIVAAENQLIIEGRIPSLALQELRYLATPSQSINLPKIKIADLQIGSLDLGRFVLDDLTLSGSWSAEETDVQLRGEQILGTWKRPSGAVSQVDFERIRLRPSGENDMAGVGDFLADLNIKSLPEVDVNIASLEVADGDYGNWSFGLRHLEDGIKFTNLHAEARDLSILAPEGLIWRQSPEAGHESRFVGELISDDLSSAMEQWGFAPSVEAERAQLIADLGWAGLPWQPQLEAFEGEIDLTIRRGRFRDIDAPAGMKLLSLLDFNAFIRRLALDFSDVFGDGVAFDEVRVKSQFADGWMRMIEPVKIDGNGSRIRIDGSVHLESGELDNEMKVTLKLSRSLPWLGAYLALLGNPFTGLGTVAIERLFRRPLEQLSTAQYDVSGTLDDPVFTLSEVEPPEPLSE